MYPQHTWFDASADEWTRYYELNVVAGVRLIQALVPDMTRARWGRVIQISSGEGLRPFAHMPGYAATKAAIHNTTTRRRQSHLGRLTADGPMVLSETCRTRSSRSCREA
jgi:NADP-dependent 3-hydroxy acid dehydrogenase YdfG